MAALARFLEAGAAWWVAWVGPGDLFGDRRICPCGFEGLALRAGCTKPSKAIAQSTPSAQVLCKCKSRGSLQGELEVQTPPKTSDAPRGDPIICARSLCDHTTRPVSVSPLISVDQTMDGSRAVCPSETGRPFSSVSCSYDTCLFGGARAVCFSFPLSSAPGSARAYAAQRPTGKTSLRLSRSPTRNKIRRKRMKRRKH